MRPLLSNSAVYSLSQRLLGAGSVRRSFVEDHLRPVPGERVLDLGCGPADVAALLADVDYVGVDSSPPYVTAARRRLRGRGAIHLADVLDFELDSPGSFDAVIAIGLLHHLDDGAARRVFELAARALAGSGRVLTLDPALAPGQPRVARRLIALDRGHSVRAAGAYAALASPSFGSVGVEVHHDLARVPYTHVVLAGREPRSPGGPAP
jgi:SAM-dependent methyltransferase